MIPEIDREKLADETRAWLKGNGLTGLNPAMISRAANCQVLSAASLLTLCKAMRRNPMRYLRQAGMQKNQTVTAFEKRETQGARGV